MLVVPAEAGEFKVTVMVDYESPVLGTQHARLDQISDFGKDIASCRTFSSQEVANLAEQGLIKGGDIDNAVVLAERAYSAEELQALPKLWAARTRRAADQPGVINLRPALPQ